MRAIEAAARAVEALRRDGGLADVFVEDRSALQIESGPDGTGRSRRRRTGACLRREVGGAVVAAHLDDPGPGDLPRAAGAACAGAWPPAPEGRSLELPGAALEAADEEALGRWTAELRDRLAARHGGARVTGVRWRQAVVVAREDGRTLEDTREGLRVHVVAPAPNGAVRWAAAARHLDDLKELVGQDGIAAEIDRRVEEAAEAGPAPVGRFPVVLAPEAAAQLVHEALAHPLETDAPASWLGGETGLPAAITVADAPGRASGSGAYGLDDEGETPRRVTLIERGHVVGHLRDRLAARRAGSEPTGHGRRQSYRDLPLPRLACTVVEPGPADPADLVGGVVRGLLVERIASGTVDPASGSLCLFAESARLVEGGRPGSPVRGLVLHGTAAEWMAALEGVGDDLRFDGGATACSKGGQSVPVIVGSPTLAFGPVPVGGVGA